MTFAEWLDGIEKMMPKGWEMYSFHFHPEHGGTDMQCIQPRDEKIINISTDDPREFDEAFRKWAEGVK